MFLNLSLLKRQIFKEKKQKKVIIKITARAAQAHYLYPRTHTHTQHTYIRVLLCTKSQKRGMCAAHLQTARRERLDDLGSFTGSRHNKRWFNIRFFRVQRLHHLNNISDTRSLDECDSAAAEARPGHTGAVNALALSRDIH